MILKRKIREYILSMNQYKRWSDYCKNDVDDLFTILMIANCFGREDQSKKETRNYGKSISYC